MPNRFAAGCGCCACSYQASDGGEYNEGFGSALSGWTWLVAASMQAQASGGQYQIRASTGFGGSDAHARTSVDYSSYSRIILQATVNRSHSDVRQLGIFLGWLGGIDFTGLEEAIWADWQAGNYKCRSAGSPISNTGGTPPDASNLTLTLDIKDIGGGLARRCYFVNGSEIASDEATKSSYTATEQFGIVAGSGSTTYRGWLDDYKVQVDT